MTIRTDTKTAQNSSSLTTQGTGAVLAAGVMAGLAAWDVLPAGITTTEVAGITAALAAVLGYLVNMLKRWAEVRAS